MSFYDVKLENYKTTQKELIKIHFESEVLPHLNENDTLYWGMGIYGLETSEDHNYLPDNLAEEVGQFVENLFPFYNEGLDPVYMYLTLMDTTTGSDDLDKIKVSDYKRIYFSQHE